MIPLYSVKHPVGRLDVDRLRADAEVITLPPFAAGLPAPVSLLLRACVVLQRNNDGYVMNKMAPGGGTIAAALAERVADIVNR